jgi:hypothetical protein
MSNIATAVGQIKTLYKENLWQGRLVLAAFIIILVLVVVRVSLPYTIIFSATYWLKTQNVTATIEDISINVIKGTFAVIGANGSKDGINVFNIGKASIDWEWKPLSKKAIHVQSVELEDFNLNAAQYSDAIEIAGIVIKDTGTLEDQAAQDEDTVAWGASLKQIDLKDLGFCFQQFNTAYEKVSKEHKHVDYCGNVDSLTWQGDFSLDNADAQNKSPGQQLTVDGTLQIKRLSLLDNLLEGNLIDIGTTYLSKIKVNGVNDIKLESINIGQLALLQNSGHPRHKHAVEFGALDITDISISNSNTIAISSISLNKPVISMARDEKGAFKYEQWLKQKTPEPTKTEQKPAEQTGDNTALTIKLGSIKIIDSEVCYEQAASKSSNIVQALDYCLNLAGSDWNGDIAMTTPADTQPLMLTVNGDLTLSSFITTNNLLQRDLLAFEKLAISKIAVKSLDDLAFGKLDLDNAVGLELTSTEDRHSMTVASLDVSAFSYHDNALAIDKLAINDLGLEITQNKDGSLDFEKWKIKTAEQPSTAKAEVKQTAAEPVKIKIGEFSLDTTRLIEFADLSVTPNMLVGLNELHFNIKQLDSEKPKQKSPIELSAKTTRHGTVNIKGVAMPFESKPSFDATGKITGVDLRVASPKAEQAIGHIIKSGQLDADLTLLSNEGQLDSKIALVLHHFKLKAKSKEDAAALDKTFGMPINQSLMLLKDKKDRIKLDIPITGDINSPEFDPTDAIIKATAKATSVTLITFFTPYGLAYAGGNVLFNIATAMNFDPLIFEPGASKLTNAQDEQLAKLVELLVERPAVHLTLCGSTNLNDRDKMFSEILNPEKAIPPPSAERMEKLKKLGSERQENVKNHLVSVGKIAHDRLILCEPEHHDDTASISGVEISI